MPVIRLRKERLYEVTGRRLGWSEVVEALFRLKCEVEEVDEGHVEIEVNPDRVDMYVGEGIGRALKGLLGVERGIPEYAVSDSDITLTVAGHVSSRPFIAAAVVEGVNITADYLEELIQFQEKIHLTYGRKRKKIAIGLHDLDKLPSKDLTYTLLPVGEVRFKPLHSDETMTAREVIERTEQGRAYGRISLTEDGYHPFILAGDEVITMPPVINADLTKVEPGTKDLFIDVTGTEERSVMRILDVIVSNLAERGGVVKRVLLLPQRIRTPTLKRYAIDLEVGYVNKVLGTDLDAAQVALHLERMRFNAKAVSDSVVRVEIPPYRLDLLHPVDLVEEVAMSIGYEELGAAKFTSTLRGSLLKRYEVSDVVANLLVGLGFQEVLSFMLDSVDVQRLFYRGELVTVENPVATGMECLRSMILPQLVALLSKNQHVELPVKIFEVGLTAHIDHSLETGVREEYHLALAIMDSSVGYEDVQAVVYSLLRSLRVSFSVESARAPGFIEGRVALLRLDGVPVGVFGEVHPEVLERLGVEYPVAGGELNLDRLVDKLAGKGVRTRGAQTVLGP